MPSARTIAFALFIGLGLPALSVGGGALLGWGVWCATQMIAPERSR